jgi:hypothetical protein
MSLYLLAFIAGLSLGCVCGALYMLLWAERQPRDADKEADDLSLQIHDLVETLLKRQQEEPEPSPQPDRSINWFISNDPEQKDSFRKYRES